MTSTTLREMLVKQEPRSVSKCYVCSGPRAEYAVYSKPYRESPFFPFLEHHQPPEGAESMRSDGRVLTCCLCYSFLNQQWDSYEKSNTPHNKRIYWLKRLDGGPFAGMDVNLQQDYESLFESSNAAIDIDCRPKSKPSRHYPSSDVDSMKSKLVERTTVSNFSFSSQSSDKPDNSVSNILDLSMSTRAPSRSSSSASPGFISEVCYTCGQESKTLLDVYVKFIRNCPYFPSLAVHPKPPRAKPIDMDGRIHVCGHCHLFLMQQFDNYQKQNIPHHERLYKVSPGAEVIKSEVQAKDKSFVCYTCGMVSQLSVQRFISAYSEGDGEPFYSFLLNSIPHPGANKLSNGKASVCSLCYKAFFRQFQVYEVSKTPEEQRKYRTLNENVPDNSSVLRRHLENNNTEKVELKFECYLCETATDKFYVISTQPTGDMYFPFIKGLPKSPSAFPINEQGQVKVCAQCHMSLTYQWNAFENAFIPINQRQYKITAPKLQIENHYMQPVSHTPPSHTKSSSEEYKFSSFKKITGDVCCLCENPLTPETVFILDTLPRENCMYFPSIRSLVKPGSSTYAMDQYGRILACNHCFSILKKQWEVFESAHVPHTQRQYEIFPSKLERDRTHFGSDIHSESSSALHIQVSSSPDLKVDLTKHPSNAETLLTTVNTIPISSITISNAGITSANSPQLGDLKLVKSGLDEPIPRICGPLDVPFIRPLVLGVPIACFVCGEISTSSITFPIRSQPLPDTRVDKTSDEVPFFPFLAKHHIPEGAEKLSNDGNALACMFCYHSLVSQWLAYETSTYPEDENRWIRRYNTHNYVCYICGITTYRKRVCSISVKNFPFLLEHSRPAGALTLLNGECVVTCQTCFESITSQWKDFERMKVPVEMRKYNWIVLPPPPDDENSRGCNILENSGSLMGLSSTEADPTHQDETGIPHGLKAPPSHLSVPTPYGVAKPGGRNVMSPVHQGAQHPSAAFSPFTNNHNPALNATRTSSFAAALRKLAKQAVDPIAEKDLSPISPASSPASSQQSSHSRYHTPLPMYLNNHSTSGQGSPSSSVPPPLQGVPSHGKALDLGRYSNNHRNGNISEPVSLKMDSSKLISSSNDKRNDISSANKHLGPPNLPPNLRQDLSRGFQPYRNSDERRSTPPQMYNPSPPPGAMSGYSYHPSFGQSSRMPPQLHRLEESVFMERYGLLRPTTLPYPAPNNMIPHPRAPIYPPSQYPPELITQSGRPAPYSNSSNSSSRYDDETTKETNIRKREMDLYREHERYLEREEIESREREIEYMRKERTHMRQSPMTQHSSSRSDTSSEDKGLMGSITHGTPRDYTRSLSPPSSTSTTPLNLATSASHMENHLPLKEEYNARHSRPNSNTINGQIHQRNTNHSSGTSYRKENDPAPYRVHYQMPAEADSKPHMENPEPVAPPSHPKPSQYYIDQQDSLKPNRVETRTLSIASVINSQINGIFARDNIASNKPYFPPTFYNRSQEPQQNHQLEYKTKTREKSPQSLNSDIPGNKLNYNDSNGYPPSIQPKEAPLNYNDSNGYPPSIQHKEAPMFAKDKSLATRVLMRIASPYEGDAQSLEEPPKMVVSVLDSREARLRKLRIEGKLEESDESGIESDGEEELRMRQILTVKPCPPIKMETDPKKTEFLSKFELVTQSKKFNLEIKKCMRRHKILREKSPSPIENVSVKEEVIEYDFNHLAELSNRLCFSEDFHSRKEFLRSLGLMHLTPEQKSEKDRVRMMIREEKLRRNGLLPPSQRCLELQGSHLRKRGCSILNSLKHSSAKKPNITRDENSPSSLAPSDKVTENQGSSMKDSKSAATSMQRLSSFLKPPMRSVNLPVPPLIPTHQLMSQLPEVTSDKTPLVVATKDPRVQQLKDFAQEFHNSVLQTTQMQLEKKIIPPVVPMDTSFQSASSTPEKSEWFSSDHRPPLRWPGMEAIMESYSCHISEQNVEKKFLVERCQKLKALNDEFNKEAECLAKKQEELLIEKNILDSREKELQSSFENLKLFIQHFR